MGNPTMWSFVGGGNDREPQNRGGFFQGGGRGTPKMRDFTGEGGQWGLSNLKVYLRGGSMGIPTIGAFKGGAMRTPNLNIFYGGGGEGQHRPSKFNACKGGKKGPKPPPNPTMEWGGDTPKLGTPAGGGAPRGPPSARAASRGLLREQRGGVSAPHRPTPTPPPHASPTPFSRYPPLTPRPPRPPPAAHRSVPALSAAAPSGLRHLPRRTGSRPRNCARGAAMTPYRGRGLREGWPIGERRDSGGSRKRDGRRHFAAWGAQARRKMAAGRRRARAAARELRGACAVRTRPQQTAFLGINRAVSGKRNLKGAERGEVKAFGVGRRQEAANLVRSFTRITAIGAALRKAGGKRAENHKTGRKEWEKGLKRAECGRNSAG